MLIVTGVLLAIFITSFLFLMGIFGFGESDLGNYAEKNNVYFAVRVNGDQIERYDGEKWNKFIIKGISLSDNLPDGQKLTQNELEDKIGEWLVQISNMNVNTIRVPSIQSPAFYNAIYEFNKDNENPLYIIQDIPLRENLIYGDYNGTSEEISEQLHEDIKDTINLLHGRKIELSTDVFTSKWYKRDISQYVLGYDIGNEWDPTFVKITNNKNQEPSTYEGKYITADSLNGFEYILAEALDYTIDYEKEKYNQQRLVSFLNTIELDPVIHSAQSSVFRDTDLNIEKLHMTSNLNTGIFASYYASTSDTDFLNLSSEGTSSSNTKNIYSNYLKQLKSIHQKPIVITNIGLSTSRAMSKEDEHYSRGGLTETQQGEYLTELLDEVYQNQYAGAFIYNWQDEWNKSTTWNTRHIKNTSNTENWLDFQSSEQHFGILQFIPDTDQSAKIDGLTSDWDEKDLLYDNQNNQLYAKYDSSYLYLMIKKEDFQFYKNRLLIAMDVNPSIGTNSYEQNNNVLDLDADFIARIHGKNDSDIQVQSRYNIFDFRYKYYANVVSKITTIPAKNTNIFDPIYLLTQNSFQNDETMEIIPPKYYETGSLVFGNSDYNSEEYNSLADFYVKGDVVELRIPWLLINVIDPTKGIALGDFYKDGLESKITIKQIGFQVLVEEDDGQITKVTSPEYIRLKGNHNTEYQERTKQSYEILQAYFKDVDKF